ncbi:MAG: DUF4139 domain-containing protein [Deltaproteobacteria bacterium]|nr:DUF4139 domain-containing protein [Deltaproteobacteria bacterium]
MRFVHLLALAGTIAGCAAGPAVLTSDALPIKRVVLYRNGVGYFERAGHFEGERLAFQVRQSEVGDFLSSLTVIERARGRVRSVSFEVPDPPRQPSQTPPPAPGLPLPVPQPQPVVDEEEEPREPRVDVDLRLDGDRHDLTVAYVVAAPIWRPSYRVVLDDEGALMQAWAVVQNISGEDWEDVRLSLTTGAPLAFQSDLGNPVTPDRPIVTDTGEVVMAIPESQTALAQGQEQGPMAQSAPATPPAEPARAGEDYDDESDATGTEEEGGAGGVYHNYDRRERRGGVASRSTRRAPSGRPMDAPVVRAPPAPPAGITAQQAQQSVTAMAAVAILGAGVTRYDIDRALTIPDGGSTMVAVLSRRVPGEEAHLFAPDPGVPLSSVHPFRVARVENRTGAMLERGPISVLARGSFLGQGVLDALPRGATAFVPFAVDRSVAVESSANWGEASARLIKVTRESVTIERFSSLATTYIVRNGGSEPIKVYVRHNRIHGATLHEPPEGTEMTARDALVPIRVPPRGRTEIRVEERTPVERVVDFMSEPAAEAIALYLSGAAIDAAAGPALQRALEIRRELRQVTDRLQTATQERGELERNAEETRQNIEAIRTVARAADLRARLVRRLSDLDARIATLTRSVVEDQTNASELRVRLSEALQDVSLTVPRAPR